MEENNNTVRCPKCGGELAFNREDSVWKCAGCHQEFSDADILYSTQYEKSSISAESYKVYLCPGCSQKLTATYDAAMTPCPFCGKPLEDTDKKVTEWEPRLILPQNTSKHEAIEILKKTLGRQKFATQYFNPHDAQNITLVYMPVWFVSGQASIQQNGINFREIIEITNMPVAPAGIMSKSMMEMIEPIDPGMAERFRPEMIAYSMVADCKAPNDPKLTTETVARIKDGTECMQVHDISRLQYSETTLVPLWIYSTEKNGARHLFAVNANSGHMAFYQEPNRNQSIKWAIIATIGMIAIAELIMLLYYIIDDTL